MKATKKEQETEQAQQFPNEPERSQTNQHRLIFYALLESAMRYREGFYREDIEQYNEMLILHNQKALDEANSFSKRKKINDFIAGKTNTFALEQGKTNKLIYDTIEKLQNTLSPAGKISFDNYSTAFGLMCEELVKAKNTTEILTVCRLYNSGAMDETFEELKKSEYKASPPEGEVGAEKEIINQQNQNTNENNNQSVNPIANISIPLMSEEQPNTNNPDNYTGPDFEQ